MRLVLPLATVGALLVGSVVLSRAMTTDRSAFPSDRGTPRNPFAACPASPNCVRLTRAYAVDADRLFAAAKNAASELGQLREDEASGAARRTLRVACSAFIFTDDLDLAVEPHGAGAALHIRSASRLGYSDLGVNGRRVRALLAAVEAEVGD